MGSATFLSEVFQPPAGQGTGEPPIPWPAFSRALVTGTRWGVIQERPADEDPPEPA